MVKANLKEIREALKIAGKVVDRKSSMPILHHVLLSTEYNGRGMNLKMIATDLENTLIYRIPLEGNTRIPEICVNYAALAKTVSAAGKRSVLELDYQDDELAAVIGRGRYPFDNKLKRDDFPRTPDIDSFESEGGGVFPARELHDALAKVAPALSDDEMRRSLSGVFFDAGRGGRLVGTDGHRLHIAPFDLEGFNTDSLLSRGALPALYELLKGTDGDALVMRRKNFLLFTQARTRAGAPEYRFISRVVDAEFPDYTQVIPTSGDHAFDISTAELRVSCERMAKLGDFYNVAGAGGKGIKVSVNGAFELRDQRGAREIVSTHGDNVEPELEIGINIKFLTDMIKFSGDKIAVSMRGIKNPILFDTDALRVVMMPFELK